MKTVKKMVHGGVGLAVAFLSFASSAQQIVFPASVIRPVETTSEEEPVWVYRAGLGFQAIDNIYGRSTSQTSDNVLNQSLGASLRSSFSQQKLVLDAALTDYRYQAHSDLDYTGTSLAGAWQWASGSNLFGNISGSRTVTQNAIGTTVNSTSRNLNTSQNSSGLVGYDFGGGWQVSGGALQASSVNEQQVVGQALVSQYSGVFVATTYVFSSGNTMSLRTLSGSGTNAYDFYVRSTEFRVDTANDAGTRLGAQLNYWRQTYPTQGQYDFSGYMGRVSADWQLTEKTSLQGGLQRQLTGVPQSNTIYTVTDSIIVSPTWAVTAKTSFKANYQKSIIRYEGDPGGGALGEVDYFQSFGLGVDWKPTENTNVSLNYAQFNLRVGSTSADTQVNIVSLNGRVVF